MPVRTDGTGSIAIPFIDNRREEAWSSAPPAVRAYVIDLSTENRAIFTAPQVYVLLDKARAAIARQEALTAEELAVCERSDFLDSSR